MRSELRSDAADRLAGAAEHRVALRVAEAVVDELEVVEVDDRQREAEAAPLRQRDPPPQLGLERAPVGQAGERVVAGGPLQLLLAQHRPPQRRQVAEHQVERVMVVLVAAARLRSRPTRAGPRPRRRPAA